MKLEHNDGRALRSGFLVEKKRRESDRLPLERIPADRGLEVEAHGELQLRMVVPFYIRDLPLLPPWQSMQLFAPLFALKV